MDYEKLHNETLRNLQEMVRKGKITEAVAKGICADFVAESEDERIIKAIKSAVLQLTDIYLQEKYALKQSDCIAWLEKQCEKPNNVCDKELSEILGRVIRRYINDPNIPYIEREKVSMEIIPYVERLEKQGEQKTDEWKEGNIIKHGGILALVIKGRRAMKSNCEIFTIQYPDEWVKAMPNEIEYFFNKLEKQGEQKSHEEIVDEINRKAFPNHYGGAPVFEMKAPEESLGVDSDTYNKIVDECIYGDDKPAWSEEDENGFGDALWAIQQARTIAKDENDMGNLWYAERWLKSIKDRVQPKQKWSEDDETVLSNLIWALKEDMVLAGDRDEYVSWLQSLKDKTIPQPKQEWSEEDESMLYGVMETEQYMLDVVNGIKKFDVGNGDIRKACAEELNWLRTLKDRVQPKQEWSEKDKYMLNNVIDTLKPLSQTTHSGYAINNMVNWLKSLRPQNTWKPSDIQLECLSDAVKHYNSLGFPAPKLKELLDDLKKLKG